MRACLGPDAGCLLHALNRIACDVMPPAPLSPNWATLRPDAVFLSVFLRPDGVFLSESLRPNGVFSCMCHQLALSAS